MTKRIFRAIFFTAVGVFTASMILFFGVLYNYFTEIQYKQLEIETNLAAQGILKDGQDYFNGIDAENYRVTWINRNGDILYDSDYNAAHMENHLEREEIQEALKQGTGRSLRYSDTLMKQFLYFAKILPDGTVLRFSISQYTVFTLTMGMLPSALLLIVISLSLSFFLAYRISKKIIKPLNSLNLEEPLSNREYDELASLLSRIDQQQKEIADKSEELKRKQNEFDAVTKNMSEGIILLNNKGIILSINPAAKRIFKVSSSCLGKDILNIYRENGFIEILKRSRQGNYSERLVNFGEEIFQLGASPVIEEGKISGTVILILNVTEKEKSEQIRREFTANVSHELKTPLHTISGCAELIANNIVKKDDISEFGFRIYSETQRLIRLVEDIIKLSHLDEGAEGMAHEKINLYHVAENIVENLKCEADAVNVAISVKGEDAEISGIRQLISGIIYNLCDNAIKYNRKNGSVNVEVINNKETASVIVSDTGIGIPPEHQDRIFERFYRVDKSHSKEIGGTGLGLSIVKHAARLHNAEISLESVYEKGTKITVRFPKNLTGSDKAGSLL